MDTEPDRLPCRSSVSDSFNRISARVSTETHQHTKNWIEECSYVYPTSLWKCLNCPHVFPWQPILGPSIPQSKWDRGYQLAVRMQILSRKCPLALSSISHTMNRLGTTVRLHGRDHPGTYKSESFCANYYCSYVHRSPPGDERPTLLVPFLPLHP